MKLVSLYIEKKISHQKFFRDYNAQERLTRSNKIIKIKHQLDELEEIITEHILNKRFPYDQVYSALKKQGFQSFLDTSEKVQGFLTNETIMDSVGFNMSERNTVIEEFENLCIRAWEDHIITSDEREELNSFCQINKIDRTLQALIERKVATSFNQGIDIERAIEYYFLEENKGPEEIKVILSKEYRLDSSLDRIESLVATLEEIILEDEDYPSSESTFSKTILFGNKKVYVVELDNLLTSGFEFEIGYIQEEPGNFKILVNKNHYQSLDRSSQIELITEAVCYKVTAPSNESGLTLKRFIELKTSIRPQVRNQF